MLASEIITMARDTMLGFDAGFLPTDAELLVRLSEEQRKLLEELLRLDNMAFVLPGDASGSVSVAVYAASYALPATLWRLREAEVTFSTGPSKTLKLVPSNWRHTVPQYTPSAYVKGSSFYPIDNGSTRIHGWSTASTVEFDFVTEPVNLTAASDTVASPDEAKGYLAHHLAHFMAVRGKVAEATLREVKELRDREKQRLMGLAKSVPGAEQFGPGS